jgi:hypothetical protein
VLQITSNTLEKPREYSTNQHAINTQKIKKAIKWTIKVKKLLIQQATILNLERTALHSKNKARIKL